MAATGRPGPHVAIVVRRSASKNAGLFLCRRCRLLYRCYLPKQCFYGSGSIIDAWTEIFSINLPRCHLPPAGLIDYRLSP